MKKSLFVAGIAALALVACKKTETVETDATMDSAAMEVVDSAAIIADSAAIVADSAAAVAEDAAATVDSVATAQ